MSSYMYVIYRAATTANCMSGLIKPVYRPCHFVIAIKLQYPLMMNYKLIKM